MTQPRLGEFSRGLSAASTVSITTDRGTFPVLRLTSQGFTMRAEDAAGMRGLVDLYDGPRHLCQCLVVAGETLDEEVAFEFKRHTEPRAASPVDFDQTTGRKDRARPAP